MPNLPPPFSLLCNLLVSFPGEMGAHSPREGGGASLLGRMRGEAASSPFSPVAGPKSSFFIRKEERGTRCYKPRPLCHSVPPPLVACCLGSAVDGVPLLSVSCPRGPSAPRAVAVSVPQGEGAQNCAPRSPPAPGFAWENPLSTRPLGDVAWGEGGRWEPSPQTPGRPPSRRHHSVITGKENCFKKKLPC